jgi:hypothetical protein
VISYTGYYCHIEGRVISYTWYYQLTLIY